MSLKQKLFKTAMQKLGWGMVAAAGTLMAGTVLLGIKGDKEDEKIAAEEKKKLENLEK